MTPPARRHRRDEDAAERYPYVPASAMTGEEWETVFTLLLDRSGSTCEARTPDCLAAADRGWLGRLPRSRMSVHHRLPRGMGGSLDVHTNALSRLLLLCGSGVTGCHGWVERNRAAALEAGMLLRRGDDPLATPLVIGGRERVWLSDLEARYVVPQDARPQDTLLALRPVPPAPRKRSSYR